MSHAGVGGGLRLQQTLPAERSDPELRGPEGLQTPHPAGHPQGARHVLPGQRLLLHIPPTGTFKSILNVKAFFL